ncbi:MAG: hypothetical protein DI582_07035 [Azospirillum brasilense]|nr:MAG: hypothetical protein DI582_07035 [Azospirillum brasilense]
MAQDIFGGIVGDVLRGGDPTRRLEQQARREAQRAARDAMTPDTVQSELREETVEQRRDGNNTLTGREMQDLLRVAERTGATIEMQPGRDEGTYVFTVNGRDRTAPLDVSPEALAVAQQSPLVEIAQPRTAPGQQADRMRMNFAPEADTQSRSTREGVTSVFLNVVTLQEEGVAKATENARNIVNDMRNLVGSDDRVEITERIRIGAGGKYIDIPPGNYTAETLMRTMADQIGLSNELRAYTREAANPTPVVNEPSPAAPAPAVPTQATPAAPAAPSLQVDPTVFSGDDSVTGGDRPASAAPNVTPTTDAPAAPQTAAPTTAAPATPEPAAATPTYTQQQLLDMGKEVTAAVTAGGADARAVEAFLGNRGNGDGKLSETEATAALNRMQALNFSPEGRAQLAELSRALQGQGVSGGDSIAGGEQQAPRATQVAMVETGRGGGVTF